MSDGLFRMLARLEDGTELRFLARPEPDYSDRFIIQEVARDNTYDLSEPHLKGGFVLDVGGNVGAFAVTCLGYGARRVVSFEIDEECIDRYKRNVELNNFSSAAAHCIWAAAGSGGKVNLVRAGGSAENYAAEDPDGGSLLESYTLDDMIAHCHGESSGRLLKIDIEGSEYDFVDASSIESFEFFEFMVMEYHRWQPGGKPDRSKLGYHKFGDMIAKLAQVYTLMITGDPMTGGLLWGKRRG